MWRRSGLATPRSTLTTAAPRSSALSSRLTGAVWLKPGRKTTPAGTRDVTRYGTSTEAPFAAVTRTVSALSHTQGLGVGRVDLQQRLRRQLGDAGRPAGAHAGGVMLASRAGQQHEAGRRRRAAANHALNRGEGGLAVRKALREEDRRALALGASHGHCTRGLSSLA